MPEITAPRRSDRPTEGFHSALLPDYLDRPVRLFLPSDYQPKYAYPLLVLFHADHSDEDAAAGLVPMLSRRNYIVVAPRGSIRRGPDATGRPGFGWDEADSFDYLLDVVAHARREFHVHTERVYLLGIGDGATMAYRLGLRLADQLAGVAVLNGRWPKPAGRPLFRFDAVRDLRVFIGHGQHNPLIPAADARKARRLLHSAGAEVRFETYSTTQRVHPDMLRDVNRWIMDAVSDADGMEPLIP
jgi:phospholipase/carboxylesterase